MRITKADVMRTARARVYGRRAREIRIWSVSTYPHEGRTVTFIEYQNVDWSRDPAETPIHYAGPEDIEILGWTDGQ